MRTSDPNLRGAMVINDSHLTEAIRTREPNLRGAMRTSEHLRGAMGTSEPNLRGAKQTLLKPTKCEKANQWSASDHRKLQQQWRIRWQHSLI